MRMEQAASYARKNKRRAPHVPWAAASWLGLPSPGFTMPGMMPGLQAMNPMMAAALAPLQELMQAQPFAGMMPKAFESGESAKLQQVINNAVLAQINRFVAGVKAYQAHPANRNAPSMPVVWERGTTKVRDYGPESRGTPVLVVPSLINRFDILDLDTDHSLLRFFAAQGLHPYVVDWGEPGDEEKSFDLTGYVTHRLFPILDHLAAKAPDKKVHLLGYCMGGNLALALAMLKGEAIRSLALMATPWNNTVTPELKELIDGMEPHLEKVGYLPPEIIQLLFASFQPAQVAQKFTRFASVDPDSAEARRFVLTEDWLNDGVPLAAEVARECLLGWYKKNTTGKIQWRIGETLIDPRLLDLPFYVLVAGKDHIVPPESARPLARLVRNAVLHEPVQGHTGLMASQSAPRDVWQPLASWFLAQ